MQYLETPTSKEDVTVFPKNTRDYSNPGDKNTEKLEHLLDDGIEIDDNNSIDSNMHLITKLVERTKIFLNHKNISLGVANKGQETIVKNIFSMITKNVNFLKYDFESNS